MTARPLSHRPARLLAAGAAAALAFLAACEADLPTAAQVENMDANSVEEVVIPSLGIDPAKLVYEVDGVVVERATVMAMDARTIEAVAVLRKGDGAHMVVRTKTASEAGEVLARDAAKPVEVLQFKEVEVPAQQPLLIVDGVVASEMEFRELDPDRIETVDVVKGEAAKRLYGDRAANGVIQVKLWADGAKRPLLRKQQAGARSEPTKKP